MIFCLVEIGWTFLVFERLDFFYFPVSDVDVERSGAVVAINFLADFSSLNDFCGFCGILGFGCHW